MRKVIAWFLRKFLSVETIALALKNHPEVMSMEILLSRQVDDHANYFGMRGPQLPPGMPEFLAKLAESIKDRHTEKQKAVRDDLH